MALHKDFPRSPHEIIDPSVRWFPADEALRKEGYEKLLPPLVDKIRKEVKTWRESNYDGASETSKALLRWWFENEHPVEDSDGNIALFKYYFCQREAVESVIFCTLLIWSSKVFISAITTSDFFLSFSSFILTKISRALSLFIPMSCFA